MYTAATFIMHEIKNYVCKAGVMISSAYVIKSSMIWLEISILEWYGKSVAFCES